MRNTSTFVRRQDGSRVPDFVLNFRLEYELRNSGTSPANRTFVSMDARPADGRSVRPDFLMDWLALLGGI